MDTPTVPHNQPNPSMRPPAMEGTVLDPFAEAPPQVNNRSIVIAGVSVGVGLVVVGVGLLFRGIGSSAAAAPAPAPVTTAAPSFLEEQRQMMHEAMDMAKEAREQQRLHMEKMRQMMEGDDGETPKQGSFRGD
jgi:hypothetical protein